MVVSKRTIVCLQITNQNLNEYMNYKSVLFSINHTCINNANEIKHTRNKMVCTSFDRLTAEHVWNIIYELKRCVFNKVLNWSREWVL